ncbi:MAG: hypothetical protein MZV63_07525 [Marinilabiliales bacterium]|nr:hypothetical protein [Marinilabiliales bacterium]
MTALASSFRLGNAIKKGIPVVIAGRPNVRQVVAAQCPAAGREGYRV